MRSAMNQGLEKTVMMLTSVKIATAAASPANPMVWFQLKRSLITSRRSPSPSPRKTTHLFLLHIWSTGGSRNFSLLPRYNLIVVTVDQPQWYHSFTRCTRVRYTLCQWLTCAKSIKKLALVSLNVAGSRSIRAELR
ncbi:hypothetical protein AG1IA_05326 [Rhizoctonia solani AG-1 IA]|uniref:Uncharacterized protein n=1 Tax=Thanatephorus cucumeris (strain AG1-IA) TaxID=983506 RepID=L8WV18_THACA|nr:hypothetical protein AG1IA_05326 [Rhizoctonia solani AG-1 IA]